MAAIAIKLELSLFACKIVWLTKLSQFLCSALLSFSDALMSLSILTVHSGDFSFQLMSCLENRIVYVSLIIPYFLDIHTFNKNG